MADEKKPRCGGKCFVEFEGKPVLCGGCEDCETIAVPSGNEPEKKADHQPDESTVVSGSIHAPLLHYVTLPPATTGTLAAISKDKEKAKRDEFLEHDCEDHRDGTGRDCPVCYKAGYEAALKAARGEALDGAAKDIEPIGFKLD